MAINMTISVVLITRFRISISGRLSATTDIMKANTVPNAAPLAIRAETTGIMPAALE